MMAALEGLWHESCILDPVTLGRTIANIAQEHYNVYVIYCSNADYQNRKLDQLMSVCLHCGYFALLVSCMLRTWHGLE